MEFDMMPRRKKTKSLNLVGYKSQSLQDKICHVFQTRLKAEVFALANLLSRLSSGCFELLRVIN